MVREAGRQLWLAVGGCDSLPPPPSGRPSRGARIPRQPTAQPAASLARTPTNLRTHLHPNPPTHTHTYHRRSRGTGSSLALVCPTRLSLSFPPSPLSLAQTPPTVDPGPGRAATTTTTMPAGRSQARVYPNVNEKFGRGWWDYGGWGWVGVASTLHYRLPPG